MDVSIVIVSYNTRELTLGAIRSAMRETTRVSHEVIVVDNASPDGSAEAIAAEFPGVRLLALPENIGFGPANNAGARGARGEYILLLNPDTVTLDHAIDTLVEFARARPEHRIYGGRTLFPDRSLNRASAWGSPTLWSMFSRAAGLGALFKHSAFFEPESLGRWERDTLREVPIISGCFLLIERALWEELGGFDDRFRMYAEEFDLCLRARAHGARPIAVPQATIVHYGGASDRVVVEQTIRQYKGRAQLLRKHWPAWKARLGIRCLDLWAANKLARSLLLSPISGRHRDLATTWRTIFARRREWWSAGMEMGRWRPRTAPASPGAAGPAQHAPGDRS
ncbi:MAG TPA: glycosyltransferase family 2 protein [Phycisphaerales bacterium]|nr:glycosyltransferase family 2 protein [Phycisphaerales bacterium]